MRRIDHSHLLELLSYDKATGIFFWKRNKYRATYWNKRWEGKRAGTLQSNGYILIRIYRVPYTAQQLAWFYVTGVWAECDVDHENKKRSDNRWENLRLATRSQNNFNSKLNRRNRSGYKGVFLNRNKWIAQIAVNGKSTHLGTFQTPELAFAAYKEAAKCIAGKFANWR